MSFAMFYCSNFCSDLGNGCFSLEFIVIKSVLFLSLFLDVLDKVL